MLIEVFNMETARKISNPVHGMSLESSPVPSDSDPDADIDAYINWHIRKTPTHADLLNAAKVKLLAEGMT